ncbi:hypothetical protein MRGA423_21555 [Mycobacterium tuberculosis RGTB423]|nr:hypothetical protein MRGA423_21555 [Mycobacterium tuberculosis RGTB423]
MLAISLRLSSRLLAILLAVGGDLLRGYHLPTCVVIGVREAVDHPGGMLKLTGVFRQPLEIPLNRVGQQVRRTTFPVLIQLVELVLERLSRRFN